MSFNLITILGATATGKTKVAVKLADQFNGEIISADSRQVYRKMDIGTGKDLSDYKSQNSLMKYHLIDIVDPKDEFNLFEFRERFNEAFKLISEEGKLPFLVGGTGLYLSAVLQNYDLKKADFSAPRFEELKKLHIEELQKILLAKKPEIHNKTDLFDKERTIKAILIAEAGAEMLQIKPEIRSVTIGISLPREEIRNRITLRLEERLNNGMIEEVKSLINSGLSFERLEYFGLEYRYISLHLKGELNYDEMFQKLNTSIHKFAKRQMTWFRKMEREGVKINWIEGPDFSKAREIIEKEIRV